MSVMSVASACNEMSTQQKLEIMHSAPINLNLDQMDCWLNDSLLEYRPWESSPLKLCVYIGEESCTSCYLKKMFQWEDFIGMEKEDEFFIYYIFTPQDGFEENFQKYFFQTGISHPFYIDKKKEFLYQNPHLPRESMFHTFLLDENNNVILVGDLLHNIEKENEFRKILREYADSVQRKEILNGNA